MNAETWLRKAGSQSRSKSLLCDVVQKFTPHFMDYRGSGSDVDGLLPGVNCMQVQCIHAPIKIQNIKLLPLPLVAKSQLSSRGIDNHISDGVIDGSQSSVSKIQNGVGDHLTWCLIHYLILILLT